MKAALSKNWSNWKQVKNNNELPAPTLDLFTWFWDEKSSKMLILSLKYYIHPILGITRIFLIKNRIVIFLFIESKLHVKNQKKEMMTQSWDTGARPGGQTKMNL